MSQKPHREAIVARVRELASEGKGKSEIGRILGLNKSTVWSICHRRGIKTLRAKPGPASGSSVSIPGWVPAEFRDDYREIARDEGEEAAASAIRKLKAEAARC